MRRLTLFLIMGLWGLAAFPATNMAQVRMFCLSVRVNPGSANLIGLSYSLTFTSSDFSPANNEVYPTLSDNPTHDTFFMLEGAEFPEPLLGELQLNVPEQTDANTNGIPDFYEVATEVPGSITEGAWGSDVANGTAKLTWQRAAGQYQGTCKIQFTSDEFGTLPEFTHSFEIIEYDGPMNYGPTNGPVHGDVHLRRAGLETSTLTGPMIIIREATNRLVQFAIAESNLTNDIGQIVSVSVGDVDRDPDYAMDYFGALSLLDGDPTTDGPDYELFLIGFDDPNDADGDGIPDLTDDASAPPSAPTLALARDGDALNLTIVGDRGATYTLEHATYLSPDEWIKDQEIVLSQTNQVVSLPFNFTFPARYYRARWP